jgi:hypothetical protein
MHMRSHGGALRAMGQRFANARREQSLHHYQQ